ncbi:MAG: hypothetical protein DWI54_00025 [Chloroflexi bacterium]|jgi:uncharacterized protein (DUF1778 family)|nr:MAG: hypothetical protein DWI55_05745 [Chloroflexota bacterium]RLT33334.1 MAG: hypothetical protein DWI54_00025 [Chloroflexota bacterium]
MTQHHERIEAEIPAATADTLRHLASMQGQSMEQFIADVLEAVAGSNIDVSRTASVVAAYSKSHQRYATLYERLSK